MQSPSLGERDGKPRIAQKPGRAKAPGPGPRGDFHSYRPCLVAAAAVAAVVALAAAVVTAAAAEQKNQNDDPPDVAAAETVVTAHIFPSECFI